MALMWLGLKTNCGKECRNVIKVKCERAANGWDYNCFEDFTIRTEQLSVDLDLRQETGSEDGMLSYWYTEPCWKGSQV